MGFNGDRGGRTSCSGLGAGLAAASAFRGSVATSFDFSSAGWSGEIAVTPASTLGFTAAGEVWGRDFATALAFAVASCASCRSRARTRAFTGARSGTLALCILRGAFAFAGAGAGSVTSAFDLAFAGSRAGAFTINSQIGRAFACCTDFARSFAFDGELARIAAGCHISVAFSIAAALSGAFSLGGDVGFALGFAFNDKAEGAGSLDFVDDIDSDVARIGDLFVGRCSVAVPFGGFAASFSDVAARSCNGYFHFFCNSFKIAHRRNESFARCCSAAIGLFFDIFNIGTVNKRGRHESRTQCGPNSQISNHHVKILLHLG